MSWLISLLLLGTPGKAIVKYGAERGTESFGEKKLDAPTRSTLVISSPELTVRGNLELEPIRVVAAQWHARIDECAKDQPDRAFTLELDVDRDGFVRGTSSSTPVDPDFDACVTQLLRDWLFARPKDKKASHIHFPLKLVSSGAPGK